MAGCILKSCVSVRHPLVTLRALGVKHLSFISLTGVPVAEVGSTAYALGQRTMLLTRRCRERSDLGAICVPLGLLPPVAHTAFFQCHWG